MFNPEEQKKGNNLVPVCISSSGHVLPFPHVHMGYHTHQKKAGSSMVPWDLNTGEFTCNV